MRKVREHEVHAPHDVSASLQHATAWFTYHAGQRMQSFNFFIVFQAGLAYALFQNWKSPAKCGVISVAGVIVAAAFYALEVRNSTLVNDGRSALLAISRVSLSEPHQGQCENLFPLDRDLTRKREISRWWFFPRDLADLLAPDDPRRVPPTDKATRPPMWATHTFVFRVLMAAAIGGWLFSLYRAIFWVR